MEVEQGLAVKPQFLIRFTYLTIAEADYGKSGQWYADAQPVMASFIPN